MIIITGASRGIGKFLFEKYLADGHEVLGLYKSTDPADLQNMYYKLDVSDVDSVNNFFISKKDILKNIVLINAAGISYNSFAHKADMNKWSSVINTNLIGSFNMIKHVLPFMRNDEYGRIINFSSVVAQSAVIGTSAYAASKSGLWGLARSIAIENGSKNITVNNINLGYFNVGMIDQVPADVISGLVEKIPARRLGKPEEIKYTVDFIISNEYLNGTSIDLNGGLF